MGTTRRILTVIKRTVEAAFFEYYFRVCTRGVFTNDDYSDERFHYAPLAYPAILKILGALELGRDDVFVDLGCGKGRALCCAARYHVMLVIGVEFAQEMIEIAEKNARALRGRKAPIEIVRALAEDFDFNRGSVVYMFNPFGKTTMNAVLDRLKQGLEKNPREVRIVYVNPAEEDVLSARPWLEQYGRWCPKQYTFLDHPVSFWRLSDNNQVDARR